MLREITFLNKRVLPDGRKHLLLRKSTSIVLNQEEKGVEFLCRKMDRDTVGYQGFLVRIKNEFSELVNNRFVFNRFHWVKKRSRNHEENAKTLEYCYSTLCLLKRLRKGSVVREHDDFNPINLLRQGIL